MSGTAQFSNKSGFSNEPLPKYIYDHSVKHRLHPVQEKLIQVTKQHAMGRMIGSTDELQLLANLVKHMGFKKTLDIGVFTGYSALTIALALPADGHVTACDVSEEYTSIGKPFWKEAGVENKINLVIAPAADTLKKLVDNGEAGTYDFAFIDADKTSYDTYYELCLKLLRPSGLIAIDNVFLGKRVLDPSLNEEAVVAMKALNQKIASDKRVDMSMINIGDGTTLVFKI